MFTNNSNFTAIVSSISKQEKKDSTMSRIATIKNDITSQVQVRSLAIAGAAILAFSAALGGSGTAHADGFELSPDWAAHVEFESRHNAGNLPQVFAQPFKLSPEWTVHVEADAQEMAGSSSYVVAEPFKFSSEWAAYVEADIYAGQSGSSAYAAPLAIWIPSSEWAALLDADAREMAGNLAFVATEPFQISPDWAALLDADAREMAASIGYVAAQPFRFSPEWAAFLDAETLSGVIDRPFNALGQ